MNNILLKISSDLLTISFIKKKENKNLNNTNVIDTKELLFSYEYVLENLELVSSFLNTVLIKNNISKVRINNIELVSLTLDLISNNNTIKNMLINDDKSINYDIFLKLLDNKTLEYLNCYDIPPFLLERLDINKNLKIDVRSEIFFMSNFMETNKLVKYSDIYYKKSLVLTKNFEPRDIEDFKTFLNINRYLKTIHLKYYSNDLIYSIVEIFKEFNVHDKTIVFYENNNIKIIVNSITYLKNIYNTFLEKNNIQFKIVYSKEYKRKNLFKQLNFITLKYMCIVITVCAFIFSALDFYKNYTSDKKLNDINNQLTDILDNYDFNHLEESSDVEYIDVSDTTTTGYSSDFSVYYNKYNQIFDELATINNETVGWLTVPSTNVNTPVVQTLDNDFYLTHDFNKNYNSFGWIYMDYRNNIYNLSNNTIIYGHNKNGRLFGSLRYVLNESWYNNKENHIITFNTKMKNMKWQIFSIYKIPKSNDYLYANFKKLNEFEDFLNFIKSRSIYKFDVDVDKNDHILTLSTCSNNGTQRLVIHAVLLDDEDEEKTNNKVATSEITTKETEE